MDIHFLLEIATFFVEVGILMVLIIEFNYDKIQIEKQHYSQRKRLRKKEPNFESLTKGESR